MFQLSKELSRRGHSVCAMYNNRDFIADDFNVFENSGVDLKFFDMGRLTFKINTLKTIFNLRNFIIENKFDIIHAHKGNAVDLAVCSTIGLNIPIVANNGVNIPLNYFQSFKYRTDKVKKIIAVSKAVKEVMIKTGNVQPYKIDVVYGSVDTDIFNPQVRSNLRQELSIPEDISIIGFAGNAHPRKGLEYLLRAFEIFGKKYKNTILVLIGVSTGEMEKYPVEKNFQTRIFPLGFRKDVPNCMAAFDYFVFPGIRDEGLTGTLREAAAMGLPSVTTDVAGNNELIFNNINGLVVPVKDSEKLSRAVTFLLENPEKASSFGQKAREFVENNMSIKTRTDSIEKIYFNLL